ncbi:MAG: putative HTH-type transcriptional regulator [Solimicrobium sp.]|jgi:DNA-binding HxlR family transcriptional regulator|nr:putative HTH-type transcriptional regulator [Solimicrobium sp.]
MTKTTVQPDCPVRVVLTILGGKWKTLIIYILLDGTRRFNELRRLIPGVTQRMLTNQLRELEEDQIVTRTVYAQVPPKVEYSLTPIGEALKPMLQQMESWGVCYFKKSKGVVR